MKLNVWRAGSGLALLLVTSLSFGQDFSYSQGDIRSAVHDDSGMSYTSSMFGVYLNYSPDNPGDSFYINEVNWAGDTGWDSLIDLQTNLSYWGFTNGVFGGNEYVLGTEISDEISWDFEGLVRRNGVIDANVAEGIYDFTVDILGGSSSTSTDLLGSFDFQIEVVDTIAAHLTASTSVTQVGYNTPFDVSTTLTNDGNRDFLTKTWYISGFGLGGSSSSEYLQFLDFEGDWFNKTIAVGSSRTDLHSSWQAANGTTPGTYIGNVGVYGGLHAGDYHSWRATPDVQIQVVPEPATMLGLAAGLGTLLRRRKKA